MPISIPDLVAAVFAKDLPALQAAIALPGTDVNVRDRDGRTALIHAAADGRTEFVAALLAKGADPNIADKVNGHTALHSAAQGFHVEVARQLLAAGVAIDAADRFGNTPLWRAVFESRGRSEMIRLLLDAGADRNRKNGSGTSPLELARRIANYNVARFLS